MPKQLKVGKLSVQAGEVVSGHVKVDGSNALLPVFLINGVHDGPTLLLYAGIHGDEFEGISACWRIKETIAPSLLSGSLIVVPIVHAAAYGAGTRTSPVDGKNLARVFPGDRVGSETDRLAHFFLNEIVSRADYAVDLHSGGLVYKHHPVVLYYTGVKAETEKSSSLLARGFAGGPFKFIWEIPSPPKNMTCTFAASSRGITSIGVEMWGEGRCQPKHVDQYVESVVKIMKYLKILRGKRENGRRSPILVNGQWLSVVNAGYFRPDVSVGQKVATGQRLGEIVDDLGGTVETVRSPARGYVGALRTLPTVKEADQPILLWTPSR